jgi:hypothetical protein
MKAEQAWQVEPSQSVDPFIYQMYVDQMNAEEANLAELIAIRDEEASCVCTSFCERYGFCPMESAANTKFDHLIYESQEKLRNLKELLANYE